MHEPTNLKKIDVISEIKDHQDRKVSSISKVQTEKKKFTSILSIIKLIILQSECQQAKELRNKEFSVHYVTTPYGTKVKKPIIQIFTAVKGEARAPSPQTRPTNRCRLHAIRRCVCPYSQA